MYKECRHIFTSGKKCQSPAIQHQNFCYFHQNTRKRPSPASEPYDPYTAPQDTAHHLTPLDDADAIQLALSDVVLALAANRIDPRRARILIYGLQVAAQNLRHRTVITAKEPAAAQTVRETHPHEDGTLIAPPKQTPDPEEVAERKRPPSLGEILLAELAAQKARHETEQLAQQQADQTAASPQPTAQPVPLQLPKIHAAAEKRTPHPLSSCRSTRKSGPGQPAHSARHFALRSKMGSSESRTLCLIS